MTEDFFTALKARLTELVQDLRYLHKPSGALIAPQIIDIMLPRPTGEVAEGEEYPFVRWLVSKGDFTRQGLVSFSVVVDAGIYVEGDINDGNAAISELCLALGRIVQVSRFAIYRLDGPVRFIIGNIDALETNPGLQAHPYYHCRLAMDFFMAGSRM